MDLMVQRHWIKVKNRNHHATAATYAGGALGRFSQMFGAQ
jgi:hypothetical protein